MIKNFSRSEKIRKKNLKKTNTPLRVVKNQEKANNSPSYRCAAIKNINGMNTTEDYL